MAPGRSRPSTGPEENDPFRIAVIDMQMPGMDGETLGRAIKADQLLTDTRMVMLTSLGRGVTLGAFKRSASRLMQPSRYGMMN